MSKPVQWRKIPVLVDKFIIAHSAFGSEPLQYNIQPSASGADNIARLRFMDPDGITQAVELTHDNLVDVINHPFATPDDVKTAIKALKELADKQPQDGREWQDTLNYYSVEEAPAAPAPAM